MQTNPHAAHALLLMGCSPHRAGSHHICLCAASLQGRALTQGVHIHITSGTLTSQDSEPAGCLLAVLSQQCRFGARCGSCIALSSGCHGACSDDSQAAMRLLPLLSLLKQQCGRSPSCRSAQLLGGSAGHARHTHCHRGSRRQGDCGNGEHELEGCAVREQWQCCLVCNRGKDRFLAAVQRYGRVSTQGHVSMAAEQQPHFLTARSR